MIEDARRGAPATLVRGGEDRDLDAVVEMGRARAAAYPFHLDRNRELVHYAIAKKRLLAGLSPPGRRAVQFFVAEEGATAVAYVVITASEGGWIIEEAADRDPSGARVGAILQALIARDPAEQRATIRAWLPRDFCPPQVRIVGRASSGDVMMVRPLSDAAASAARLREEDVLYWHADVF